LSAAGGGLLAAAFIQTAVAHADVFNFVPDPSYAERPVEFTALGGLPPLDQTVGATLEYNVVSAASGETVGHFLGVSSQDEDLFGLSTHEILALGGGNTTDAPTPDSLFSTSDVFGIQNVYSDIVGGTAAAPTHTITDTFVTPFGDLNVPVSFDAAAALPAADFTSPSNSAFDAGDAFVPGTESYTSISALPLDQTISGTVGYAVENAAGTPTGATFQAVFYHDVSAFSPSDQEIFVSGSSGGAGAPGDGSIFNTVDYGHGVENVYSDVVGTGTDPTHSITDTVVTPFGDFAMPTSFDAAAAGQPVDFSHPAIGTDAGYTFTATGPESYTAIGTHPFFDQSISGTQDFSATGAYDGSFTGTVTNTVDALGVSNQEIVVTEPGATGLTDGSIFDTLNLGHGFENVYADILGAGGTSTVTDTLVTPLGDVNLPVFFDATSALPFAEFIAPGGSTAADFASLLNPADFSGLLSDFTSVLDLGSFLTF
jgi:hypothetical protein